MNILLVEDDYNLAQAIVEYLELDGILCDYAENGAVGLELLRENFYQVVVLDINLPRLDGLSICKALRDEGNDIPVIMLTARDNLEDKLDGFTAGTDDYLVKPFAMDELVARVKALSGRISRQGSKLRVADLELSVNQHLAVRNGRVLNIPPTGLRLLKKLMLSSPQIVSKEELIYAVWGEHEADNNTLQVHIHKLRKEIAGNGESQLIRTVKFSGYSIVDSHAD